MMRFSKKVEYALIALVEMADKIHFDDLVTARSLAKQYHIPQEIMGKVLQTLTRQGLLLSVQGVKGGYTLARPVDKINLLEVVESIDGPLKMVSCNDGKLCDCEQLLKCNIRTPMQVVQDEFAQLLYSISLKDLMTRMQNNLTWIKSEAASEDNLSNEIKI